MKNFMKWSFYGVLFLAIWITAVTNKINHPLFEKYPNTVFYFPLIFAIFFGIYSMTVILWRVYTFNNCEEAAVELKNQIMEAKADLEKKGFVFDSYSNNKTSNKP